MGMSMRRYLPAMGTAGSLRVFVRGESRAPRPPPRIRLRTRCMARLAARVRERRAGTSRGRPRSVPGYGTACGGQGQKAFAGAEEGRNLGLGVLGTWPPV